jgi:hypothetical protein
MSLMGKCKETNHVHNLGINGKINDTTELKGVRKYLGRLNSFCLKYVSFNVAKRAINFQVS